MVINRTYNLATNFIYAQIQTSLLETKIDKNDKKVTFVYKELISGKLKTMLENKNYMYFYN